MPMRRLRIGENSAKLPMVPRTRRVFRAVKPPARTQATPAPVATARYGYWRMRCRTSLCTSSARDLRANELWLPLVAISKEIGPAEAFRQQQPALIPAPPGSCRGGWRLTVPLLNFQIQPRGRPRSSRRWAAARPGGGHSSRDTRTTHPVSPSPSGAPFPACNFSSASARTFVTSSARTRVGMS